jgi:hypothetical protein
MRGAANTATGHAALIPWADRHASGTATVSAPSLRAAVLRGIALRRFFPSLQMPRSQQTEGHPETQ